VTSLGTKRTCQACGSKYYDFDKDKIDCPSCGVAFDPEVLLKSRRIKPVVADKTVKSEKNEDLVDDVEIDDDIEDDDNLDDVDDENVEIIAVPNKDDDDDVIDDDALVDEFLDTDEDEDDN